MHATAKPTGVVTSALQDSLVELIDLALQAKQYHWNVVGPNFRAVHVHLDELTDEVRGWYDDVAERLVALGVAADGRSGTVASGTPLPEAGDGWQRDADTVAAMAARVDQVAGNVRRRAVEIGDDDLISQDLLVEVGAGLEKQAWMLRAQAA
jgi:starvation-inducible DNA-binding protein